MTRAVVSESLGRRIAPDIGAYICNASTCLKTNKQKDRCGGRTVRNGIGRMENNQKPCAFQLRPGNIFGGKHRALGFAVLPKCQSACQSKDF